MLWHLDVGLSKPKSVVSLLVRVLPRCLMNRILENVRAKCYPLMKKSYVSVLISVVKLELAAQNILKMMDTG